MPGRRVLAVPPLGRGSQPFGLPSCDDLYKPNACGTECFAVGNEPTRKDHRRLASAPWGVKGPPLASFSALECKAYVYILVS